MAKTPQSFGHFECNRDIASYKLFLFSSKFHLGNLEHIYTQCSYVAVALDTFSYDTAVLHLSSNIFHWLYLLVVIASFSGQCRKRIRTFITIQSIN